jgi:lipoprotein-anchoring transpeptidase ErfK/SrfK
MATAQWRDLWTEAKEAFADGQRTQARRLARKAAQVAPDQEEPWLLLAALATPRGSLEYLKQALTINPRSARAKKALRWAEERAENANKGGDLRTIALTMPRWSNVVLFALLMAATGFALFAWLRPPSVDNNLRFVSAAAAQEINALFPTSTSTPTATHTSTNTSSPTPSSSPTNTPTPTETATATETFTPTATSTNVANPEAINKLFVELPNGLGPVERWIDIDLTAQTLSAYEGGDLVNHFVISSGRGGSPTVTGQFNVWAKVRIQAMSGVGYYIENVPWVMYFYKDYGIHGTWWHNNFGTPMSAGCINMSIPDAEWMYGWASIGTIVKVHY